MEKKRSLSPNGSKKIKKRIACLGSGLFFEIIQEKLKDYFVFDNRSPEIIIVANYGRKISAFELEKTPHLNVHPSLLPRLKGATPIQTAILKGWKKSGYTIIQMDEKIDHGPILFQKEVKLADNETYASFATKIARQAGEKLIRLIPDFLSGKLKPFPQSKTTIQSSWTKKISSADRKISWQELRAQPRVVERKIRAFYPSPKAYLELDGRRLLIHRAKLEAGKIKLLVVQLEGKRALAWEDFLRGWRKRIPDF